MKFFADEGVDFPLVDLLRNSSFIIHYAAEEMRGATDKEVLEKCLEYDCILVTKDKDFGELVIRNNLSSKGVILIRIENLSIKENCLLVASFIKKYSEELSNSFTVIQEDKIRIRKLIK